MSAAPEESIRVVLVKPGDVLLIGNVAISGGEHEAFSDVMTAFKQAVGIDHVMVFADDITMGVERGEPSEPEEIRHLPVEVRQLVHAVDRMRENWADNNDAGRAELWQRLHGACYAVWNRESS